MKPSFIYKIFNMRYFSVILVLCLPLFMVQAQQTRQILDKLVGYKLSPVLWKQIGNRNLSAGRVQSVALRMICEREEEIEAFIPQEYWSIHTIMDKDGKLFEAEVNKYKNKKIIGQCESERLYRWLQRGRCGICPQNY